MSTNNDDNIKNENKIPIITRILKQNYYKLTAATAIALAAILVFSTWGFAYAATNVNDNLDDQLAASVIRIGDTTTINYWIQAVGQCDATSDPATVSLTISPGSGLTGGPLSFPLGFCGSSTTGFVQVTLRGTIPNTYTVTATGIPQTPSQNGQTYGTVQNQIIVSLPPPPPPVFTSPTAGNNYNTNSIPVSGNAQPGSTVTVSEGSTVLGTATAANDGSWNIGSKTFTDGSHALTAVAGNALGQSPPSQVTFTVSTTSSSPPNPPTITSSTPSSGTTTNNPSVTLSGTAQPSSTIRILDNGVVIGTATVASPTGSWTTQISLQQDGRHSLTATATNAAGTSGPSSPVIITLDRTAFVSITSPNRDTLTNAPSITISGTADQGSTVQLYDKGTPLGSSVTADSNGAWQVILTSEGSYSITARATDPTGNTAPETSPALLIIIDRTVPTVSITRPTADTLTHAPSITISGTASEGGSRVDIINNGVVIDSVTADSSTGAWSYVLSAEGVYHITARATDLATNQGSETSPILTIIIDRTPPAAPTNLKSSGGNAATPAVTVTGSAEAGSTVNVYDGNSLLKSATATGGTFSIDITGLADGSHDLSVTATDAAGNEGQSTGITVSVDTKAPTLTLPSSPLSFGATGPTGAKVTYTVTATDNIDNGGLPFDVTAFCSPASNTIFGLGTKTVNCDVQDKAGNHVKGSFDVKVVYPTFSFQPPTDPTRSNAFKIGSSIPAKFTLKFADGTSASTCNCVFSFAKVDNKPDSPVNELVYTMPSDTGSNYRWDSTQQQYIYNVGTKTLTAGSYKIYATTDDGVVHSVQVELAK
jgi:Big-like domain-containing protein